METEITLSNCHMSGQITDISKIDPVATQDNRERTENASAIMYVKEKIMTGTKTRETKRGNVKHECDQQKIHKNVYIKLKELPAFSDLKLEVQHIVDNSTWWEIRGIDWMVLITSMMTTFLCVLLLQMQSWWAILIGGVVHGLCHSTLSVKGGHLATHGVLSTSPYWNKIWVKFFVEFLGSYTGDIAFEYHIKIHHPHTNIIGLGDSSTWRISQLSRYPYMFIAPLAIPLITPFVAISQLWGRFESLVSYITILLLGYAFNIYLLCYIANFTFYGAVAFVLITRTVLIIPYIHVNIFQHIGLSMYSKEDRPIRLYQMSTGVLNLSRNPVLDWCFGFGILNCHVEHHLFPHLSDYMCQKIKPVVSAFIKRHHLPYHQDDYMNRLQLFLEKYEELMVNAPTILHFVGIQ